MAGQALQILGLGACTPIGRNVWSTAAAARAGMSGFFEHPFMVDTAGEPMRVARAPWLDAGLDAAARMEALLLPAILEALEALAGVDAPPRLGLALALPARRPGRTLALAEGLLGAGDERVPGPLGRFPRF